jgi:hypothetical protein
VSDADRALFAGCFMGQPVGQWQCVRAAPDQRGRESRDCDCFARGEGRSRLSAGHSAAWKGDNQIGNESLSVTVASLAAGRADAYQSFTRAAAPHGTAFDNLSLYAQDSWRFASRGTLTYGIRWEFVVRPHATEGDNPITLDNLYGPYGGRVSIAPVIRRSGRSATTISLHVSERVRSCRVKQARSWS